jgi:hypothetical protein
MEPDTATRALQEGEATTDQVPPGIRCSQEAFWRELPELLPKASRKRRWVAYHGDERIGFGRTETELYQECYRRGLSEDEICIGRLRPVELAPWETDVGEVAWYDYEDDLDDQDS